MNGYKFFFNGKETEVYAESMYAAKLKAVEFFKPRKSQVHMVHGVLCQRSDGSTVIHSTAF